jgi:cyclic beta-1,2-glucan synthetase
MHRAGVEYVLGLRIEGAFLHLDPCIPKHWRRYEMTLKRHSSCYEIVVENPNAVSKGIIHVEYDGIALSEDPLRLPLEDDGRIHTVKVTMGPSQKGQPA